MVKTSYGIVGISNETCGIKILTFQQLVERNLLFNHLTILTIVYHTHPYNRIPIEWYNR